MVILEKYDMPKIHIFSLQSIICLFATAIEFCISISNSLIHTYLKLLNVYLGSLELCYTKTGTNSKDSISLTHSEFTLKQHEANANLHHLTVSEDKKERRLECFPKIKLRT